MLFYIVLASLLTSIVFSIGGVGSAIAIIPIMHWLGVPLNVAKPTGLFINILSMSTATVYNIKSRKLDFKLALPVIISTTLTSPLGAYSTKLIPEKTVIWVLIAFLLYSGSMMLLFKPKKIQGKISRSLLIPISVGAIAGFLGGLLGVGGGGIISPSLILLGHDPKRVAGATALIVAVSSSTGFVEYAHMGSINATLLIAVSSVALIGGWLGTRLMHNKMSSTQVKKAIGVILFLFALKMIGGMLR